MDISNVEKSGGRRKFLQLLASGAVLMTAGSVFENPALAIVPASQPEGEKEVFSPTEVLMRDHGLLKRVLLIYGECIRRINAGSDLSHNVIADSAKLIRSFIEDYHEKLEENYLFPKFRDSNKLVDLVDVLSEQHKAGRKLTDITLSLANAETLKSHEGRKKLTESLSLFIRMFNPHEAREDTVLFPALRTIMSPDDYQALGEYFEFKELEYFVTEGSVEIIDKIAKIEKSLGIYDLSQFTPKA